MNFIFDAVILALTAFVGWLFGYMEGLRKR
jgi:hypothetical protein